MFGGAYRDRKVLVTGHTGFKGSWLSQWLLELGADVCGYSIDIPTRPAHFDALGLEKKMAHHLGDIRDLGRMSRVFAEFRPEIVFHLAAQPLVRASYDDPKATFDTNLGGTVNVLEAVRKTPSIRVAVFVATDKCYENVEWEYGYRENDPLGGKDPYSASKACAEIAFSSYYRSFIQNQRDLRMASARAGNVIGGGDWAADRIVPDCVRAWAEGKPVRVRNPGSTRPWQHVLEPLSGYLWLGARLWTRPEGATGEAFNFGPQDEASQPVSELIRELRKVWSGGALEIDSAGSGLKKEAGQLRLCCDKALNRLQWKASLGFDQAVRMTAEWYRDFYDQKPGAIHGTIDQIREYQEIAAQAGRAWTQ